jgi:hypothetical protein
MKTDQPWKVVKPKATGAKKNPGKKIKPNVVSTNQYSALETLNDTQPTSTSCTTNP